MKLAKFKLKNFRSYKEETEIDFNNLTVFVGKNDIGKSTILEALDIFFNEGKGTIKVDVNDINVQARKAGEESFKLTAIFSDLPSQIIIDDSAETSLEDEYMLNADGLLEVSKEFKKGASKPITSIKAIHPTNPECSDLLQKKNRDLIKIIDKLKI